MTLADWRDRLREDPEGTVAELVRRFGPRRSTAPEVEDLFWRVLVDLGGSEDLAMAVLGRLRVPDDPCGAGASALLDLDREHRVRLRGGLRMIAAEVLGTVMRDPAERERTARHPSRLADVAFARRGHHREAAALYALEHDHLGAAAGERRGSAGHLRLGRAALRYEVARAVHRVEGCEDLAVGIMGGVVRLVDDALEATGSGLADRLQLAWRLSFHSREWLGFRHFDGGRYADAEREFLRAAGAAPETDLAVAARMFAVNAMIRDGRRDEARDLLDTLRADSGRLSPPIADQWLELRDRLIEEASEETGGDEDARSTPK